MILEIDGIAIEVIRKPIKSLNLRIYPPHGVVKLSVPLRYSEGLIRQHLQNKSSWIQNQREQIQQRVPQQDDALETGSSVLFQGKRYLLVVEEHHGPSQITLKDEIIHLYTKSAATHQQKRSLLDNWYKREMEKIVPDLITHWERMIKVRVAEWGVKKMKTRWGSCNTRAHRIWLNLNLMKKPIICLEYVLVHELIHLLEASHNQRFYQFMEQFMPNWREYEYLLEGRYRKK